MSDVRAKSQVEVQVDRLAQLADRERELCNELETRLRPILSPCEEKYGEEGVPEQVVPLAGELREIADSLDISVAILSDILARLEL